jgi:hypothetical protein
MCERMRDGEKYKKKKKIIYISPPVKHPFKGIIGMSKSKMSSIKAAVPKLFFLCTPFYLPTGSTCNPHFKNKEKKNMHDDKHQQCFKIMQQSYAQASSFKRMSDRHRLSKRKQVIFSRVKEKLLNKPMK